MSNTFEFIGKLSIGKESESFKPFEETSYPSGWDKYRLLFNVQAAENRHMLTSEGMAKADGTGIVYTFSKQKVDPITNVKTKGESLQVPWKDRFKPEVIEKVAEFKKFVIDFEKPNRRYELEAALKKQEKGELTEEELKELGVDDIAKALEESKKKRKEFISEYDYTEFLHKIIKSGKFKDMKFKVLGEIVYSEYNGKFYKKYSPQRIYLANSEEKETSTGQLTIYFNKESLDENSFEDTGKLYVNGFIRNYDSSSKEDIPCPVQLVIDGSKKDDEKVQKFTRVMKSQFTVEDDSWKEFGVKVKLLDGAQKVDITEDMLTDFQKEMLELDVITMDDIKKELDGDIYGDKIQEMVIVNVARGFSKGRKDTVYVDSDFEIKPVEVETEDQTNEESESNTDDLFNDLDMEDIL